MVVMVRKQTKIRELIQGINREGIHFTGLQVLIYNDEDDTNNDNYYYLFIMAMSKMNVLLKLMLCRGGSGYVLGSRAPSCFSIGAFFVVGKSSNGQFLGQLGCDKCGAKS